MGNALVLNKGNVIADVTISAKQAETHSFRAVATEYAIQDGSIASDHVILKPFELQVEFTSSNTPGNGFTPQQVYSAFEKHWFNRDLLKVVTEHATHENMIIESFEPLHRAPHKGALYCSIRFKQIPIVKTSTINYVHAIDSSAIAEVNRGVLPPVIK